MFSLLVKEVRFFTPEIFELSLERGGYVFESGECAVVFDAAGDSRPYSIASGSEEPVLRFLLRRFSGGAVSSWLADRQPGDTVCVSPPFGEFRPAESESSTVFIATGVGIAPFLSVLRGLGESPIRPFTCFYGVRTLKDAVLLPTLRDRADLHLAVSREKTEEHFHGRVTGLLETVELPDRADYFLCGHDAMVDEVFDHLRTRSVPASRIHTEVFFSSVEKH